MKILFFYAFIIGSVAVVAADNHKDQNSIEGSHLRATKRSRSNQATTTSLFDVELESDISASVKKEENKSRFVPPTEDESMLLDEEIQLALEGLNESQRNIQLAAYVEYTQNHISMEEINMKYRTHGHDNLDVEWDVIPCCKDRTDLKCFDSDDQCEPRCKWFGGAFPNVFNDCCAPENRGKIFFVWETCQT